MNSSKRTSAEKKGEDLVLKAGEEVMQDGYIYRTVNRDRPYFVEPITRRVCSVDQRKFFTPAFQNELNLSCRLFSTIRERTLKEINEAVPCLVRDVNKMILDYMGQNVVKRLR